MKTKSEHPIRKPLYTAIASALVLGVSVVMSSHAQEAEPVEVPEVGVVETEVPEADVVVADVPELEPVQDEIPEPGQLPAETEPLPTLPEGLALDNDGNVYPEGGPAGLYNAITDKQQKVGMEGVYDVDGNLEGVTYVGGNYGQQNALARLRENLERKLKKLGLFDDAPEVPDTGDLDDAPVAEALAVSTEEGVSKWSTKTAKLSTSTEKSLKLEKTVKPEKVAKVEKVEKAAKPVKVERIEKAQKPLKVERIEKPQKPVKVTRVERPQRPEKISRVEKPQKPEKVSRVERPQKPEKVSRVEKPQRPEKAQKPEKPERPGRS